MSISNKGSVVPSTSNTQYKEVSFNKMQLEYIQHLFPVLVFPHTTSEAELRAYFGKQEVVAAIAKRTRYGTTG